MWPSYFYIRESWKKSFYCKDQDKDATDLYSVHYLAMVRKDAETMNLLWHAYFHHKMVHK